MLYALSPCSRRVAMTAAALAVALFALCLFSSSAFAAVPDCYVAPGGLDANDGLTPAAPKKNIQACIDAVDAGGAVHIAAGTYLEDNSEGYRDLHITQSLSLIGAGSTQTIVQLRTEMNGVEIYGANLNVTLQGIAFAPTTGSTWGPSFALRFAETGSSFTGITLRDVEVSYARARNVILSSPGTFSNVVVENSKFHHSGAYGFSIDGQTTGLTILNSDFTDNGADSPELGYGLDIAGKTSNIQVTGGQFNRNTHKGINLSGITNAVFDGITAMGNTSGLGDVDGFVLADYTTGSSNVTIKNSVFSGNKRWAMMIGVNSGKTLSGVSVETSYISGQATIYYGFVPTDIAAVGISNISFHHNSLDQKLVAFLYMNPGGLTAPVGLVNAEYNWWGNNAGAIGKAGNVADGNPWLLDAVDGDPAIGFQPYCTTVCYVSPSGNDSNLGASPYSPLRTIQAALVKVAAGGTVNVANGTYVENLSIANKPFTLLGESRSGVIIQAATTADGFLIGGDVAITLKHFSMQGLGDSGAYGLKPSGDHMTAVVEDVTIDNFYRSQFDFNGLDGLTLTNVIATNADKGNGVALTDVSNATLSNITTSGNAWEGIAVRSQGHYYPINGTNNVVFAAPLSIGEVLPVMVELNEWPVGSGSYKPATNITVPGYEWAVTNFSGATEKKWYLYPSQPGSIPAGGTVAHLAWPASFYYPSATLRVDSEARHLATGVVTFDIPVKLAKNGLAVSSVQFNLGYAGCLTLDSVTPASGFIERHDAGTHLFSVYPPASATPPTLPDGTIAMLHFTAASGCGATANEPDQSFYFAFSSPVCGGQDGYDLPACSTADGTVTVDFNEAPTAVALTPLSVAENSGAYAGTLSATDPDGDALSFATSSACAAGDDADNGLFTVTGTAVAGPAFNYEMQSSYKICIAADDGRGSVTAQAFVIAVTNVNEPPTDVTLTPSQVAVDQPAGATVGTLAAIGDPDVPAEPYAFAITGGSGAAYFTVVGNQLRVAAPLAAGTYSLEITVTDSGSPSSVTFVKTISVTVLGSATLSIGSVPYAREGSPTHPTVPVNYDPNGNAATSLIFKVSYNAACLDFIGATAAGGVSVASTEGSGEATLALTNLPAVAGKVLDVEFAVLTSCPGLRNDVALTLSKVSYVNGSLPLALTLSNGQIVAIENNLRGDCNASGVVNAADFPAIVLEIFDEGSATTSGLYASRVDHTDADWLTAPFGNFTGSPIGCDANDAGEVGSADLTCAVNIVFGDSACTAGNIIVASIPPAVVAVEQAVAVSAGQALALPVTLQSAGNKVGGVAFTIQLDPALVAFDPADADGDGLPDAVQINVQGNLLRMVSWNAERNQLQVAVAGIVAPMAAFGDGAVATINVTGVANGALSPLLTGVSAGSVDGFDVPVTVPGAGNGWMSVLLPAVRK